MNVNYNFTEGVRRAFMAARTEAIALGHDYVDTEHMLLGALHDTEVAGILERLGVRPAMVAAGVHRKIEPLLRTRTVSSDELPYTSRAKKVIEYCMSEARDAREDHVGTSHLLLALVREGKGIAADVLREQGVTLERARTARAGEVSRPPFHVRIDDASDRSIYEQIVAQVTEAIATGALQPGERLPTVRQLADELDIAPGTVARAYGELEGQKRIVTEGARGTRVAERTVPTSAATDLRETLAGLLRPVAVAGFHLGATAEELRAALEEAMRGIFDRADDAA